MRYVSRSEAERYCSILGMAMSRAMREIHGVVKKIAPTPLNVLVVGESGTGKELIARCLHHYSNRSTGPFVAVNCAALPEHLVESELYGHEKGAFTGATAQRIGKLELAHGGSVLLDEVGDMPLAAQAKTLRVLQERELERIGGNKTMRLDIRIISATNKHLEQAVRRGSFRQDLFYRLGSCVINVPPLRDRREDIPYLATYFLRKYAHENGRVVSGISEAAMAALMEYSFPGNVRELENIIQVASVFASRDRITSDDLPAIVRKGSERERHHRTDGREGDELLAVLGSVMISDNGGGEKLWHASLRTVSIETIHEFLIRTDGREFSRQEFASFLGRRARDNRNKYGTVGRYLSILRRSGIVARNDKKANETRYKLCKPLRDMQNNGCGDPDCA